MAATRERNAPRANASTTTPATTTATTAAPTRGTTAPPSTLQPQKAMTTRGKKGGSGLKNLKRVGEDAIEKVM